MSSNLQAVAVFGSTGSIGTQTLEVIRFHRDRFRVAALAAGANLEALVRQCLEFRPEVAVIAGLAEPGANPGADAASAGGMTVTDARRLLAGEGCPTKLLCGPEKLREVAAHADYDILVAAVTGSAGLDSTLEAARRGKRVALANKESLVMAGPLLMAAAATSGAELLPVDSEHSAIWQCLFGVPRAALRRVILTASGGPFRCTPLQDLKQVTLQQALKHPTWEMGAKITVDSATMFNKALEVIEARWLFQLERDQLDVVIHPQSVIHSMVEFADMSIIAQLGPTDMKLPIQLALSYPQRLASPVPPFSFATALTLSFEAVEQERFPSVALGMHVAWRGGVLGASFNAANEVANQRFRNGEIHFLDIYRIVEGVVRRHDDEMSRRPDLLQPDLEAVRHFDHEARRLAAG